MEVQKNKTEYVVNDATFFNLTFLNLNTMRGSQEMCNLILISNDNINIHCHRLVLAASSPYFRAMFSDFKEQYQKEIKLKWANSQMLSSIIDYIYTSKIIITQKTVEDLLAASDILQLTKLRTLCIDFLEEQLDVDNCLGIAATADLYSCSKLFSQAQKLTEQHFTDIIESKEFLDLPIDRLINILCSDHLNVKTEETVLESVLKWLKHDLANREKYFADLLKNIRVKLLSPEYIVQKLAHSSVLERQINGDLFLNLLKFKYDVSNNDSDRNCFNSSSTKRKAMDPSQVLVILGGYGNKNLGTVEFYDFDTNKWHNASDMREYRDKLGASVLNGQLYVAGGKNSAIISKTVEIYDSETNEWSALLPMMEARQTFGFNGINNTLCAVGGYNKEKGYVNTCEQFDMCTQKWSHLPPMLWKAGNVGSQIFQNTLYIIGGYNGAQYLKSAQAFDFNTQKWSKLPDMSCKRSDPATCVLNEMLYVCGGMGTNYLDSVEFYDPETNTWTLVESMNIARTGARAFAYKGLIYVTGGYNGSRLSSIEIYDPKHNLWSISPIKLPLARSHHANVLMNKSCLKLL